MLGEDIWEVVLGLDEDIWDAVLALGEVLGRLRPHVCSPLGCGVLWRQVASCLLIEDFVCFIAQTQISTTTRTMFAFLIARSARNTMSLPACLRGALPAQRKTRAQ